MDNVKLERKMFRRGIGGYTWALLVYYVIMNVAVTMTVMFEIFYQGFRSAVQSGDWNAFVNVDEEQLMSIATGSGWGYLISCVIAVLMILGWKGGGFFRAMFRTRQRMSGGSIASLVCLFLSGQLLFQTLAIGMEFVLNQFGLSLLESMEMASAGADTFSMFLYMGIGAPVVEEIVFRGLIMRGLEPYGRRFAVFASALLFGLFHGNLVQTPYAFAVGLLLGYTAMEYSIGWAMVLHMVNNLVLGDSLPRLLSGLPEMAQGLVQWGLILICAIAALVILIVRYPEIREYRQADPMDRRCLRGFFTAVPNYILLILMAVSAVSMLMM